MDYSYKKYTRAELMAENGRRMAEQQNGDRYNPLTGDGCCGDRVPATAPDGVTVLVPRTMTSDMLYAGACGDTIAWQRLRCHHDFEYWCARCITIKDKLSARAVPFVLNRPQRRVAAMLEEDRLAGRPLRLIMLKARQWGGSTLVQMYMAWIQLVHRTNWHSLICAHVKDTAATIRGMYTNVLRNYPEELWEGDESPQFRSFERSLNTREIAGRGCRVTLASAEKQDAVRGGDYVMAHLSETAFWPESGQRSPRDFVRAVCGAIARQPLSLIAMESTANGVGNYFHNEWLRCASGAGDKRCVFVPWYEIEIYSSEPQPGTELEFYNSFDDYEQELWCRGLTLAQICWYRGKSAEYPDAQMMHAEYPTTPDEAFINTGSGVFPVSRIEALRAGCCAPAIVGEVNGAGMPVADTNGCLKIWEYPDPEHTYIVAVDIGGRTPGADWSVIAVLDDGGGTPRVVAQWRGHIDHDLLADKAMAIGRLYNNALLVVESNTLESEEHAYDESLTVLSRMALTYSNIYTRTVTDRLTMTVTDRVGFHTNRRTKPLLVQTLISAVRDGTYIERDNDLCNELATYQQLPNGAYAARAGNHDDILMTRALALYILSQTAPTEPVTPLLRQPVW